MNTANEQARWFSSDLLNNTVRYGLVGVGAISAVLGMAGDFTEGNLLLRTWLIEHGNTLNIILHLVLITLILFPARIRPLSTDTMNPDVRRMANCINDYFLTAWKVIWASFGVMYLITLFVDLEPHHFHRITFGPDMYDQKMLESMLSDLTDVGSTAGILFCGAFVSPMFFRRYALGHDERAPDDRQLRAWKTYKRWLVWGMAIGCIALLAGVLVARFFALDWIGQHIWSPDSVVHYLLGWLSAVALGILAGRLDSPFIANWHWMILLLYLYGSMQLFSQWMMADDAGTRAAFLYMAFSLKCLWFVFVSDLFANKRILYYAYESLRPMREREY